MYTNSSQNATVEKLTLTPRSREIIVNTGSLEGVASVFSYEPVSEEAARTLGALYVIGHRGTEQAGQSDRTDSEKTEYIISLIAALARREYYGQEGLRARDAFAHTLKKINEVIDEFFRSANHPLSVGVFAIVGATILASKLDKFRMLLAREGQVVDILNSAALSQKERIGKRQFSNIISGSVQPGDRVLAYYPSRAVAARERQLKGHLLKLESEAFAAKLASIGQEHNTFATAMISIDMVNAAATTPTATLAWTPRQTSAPHAEAPNIIQTEFSLARRKSGVGQLVSRVRFVRLDGRGKAAFFIVAVLIITGIAFGTRSFLFTGSEQQKLRQAVGVVSGNLEKARILVAQNQSGQARQMLVSGLASLVAYENTDSESVKNLAADIITTMDALDNAVDAELSLMSPPTDIRLDPITSVAWSSASNSLWIATAGADGVVSVSRLTEGAITDSTELGPVAPLALVPFKSGVLAIDGTAKKIVRITDGTATTFPLTTADAVRAVAVYNDTLYTLTDKGILKTTDLDTDSPVTKQWLADVADLAQDASRLYVDGAVYTLGADGVLATYYKGKKISQIKTQLEQSGAWDLVAGPQTDRLAVANGVFRRVYALDIATGVLTSTLKLDTKQEIIDMASGPDGSTVFVTKDNKIWKAK